MATIQHKIFWAQKIWKFRNSSSKCYVDHPHTIYSSWNLDVRNQVHLFESPCTCVHFVGIGNVHIFVYSIYPKCSQGEDGMWNKSHEQRNVLHNTSRTQKYCKNFTQVHKCPFIWEIFNCFGFKNQVKIPELFPLVHTAPSVASHCTGQAVNNILHTLWCSPPVYWISNIWKPSKPKSQLAKKWTKWDGTDKIEMTAGDSHKIHTDIY